MSCLRIKAICEVSLRTYPTERFIVLMKCYINCVLLTFYCHYSAPRNITAVSTLLARVLSLLDIVPLANYILPLCHEDITSLHIVYLCMFSNVHCVNNDP
jgi:hypothetical protein